jgi:hypothetical protein
MLSIRTPSASARYGEKRGFIGVVDKRLFYHHERKDFE